VSGLVAGSCVCVLQLCLGWSGFRIQVPVIIWQEPSLFCIANHTPPNPLRSPLLTADQSHHHHLAVQTCSISQALRSSIPSALCLTFAWHIRVPSPLTRSSFTAHILVHFPLSERLFQIFSFQSRSSQPTGSFASSRDRFPCDTLQRPRRWDGNVGLT
jgi:hypothetical protein